MTTLGQRIREHRRRAGLSQEALARRMDVSRQAVTKWESGQSAPSTENLFRLAELFGTTVDLLLPSEGADAPAAEAPPPLWSRSRRRPRVLAALAVTAGYLVFYLLGPHPLVPPGGQLPAGLAAVGAAQPAGRAISTAGSSAAVSSGGPWPSPP